MVHAGEDSQWAQDWSEDVERTYDAPPPAGLTDFDLSLYRRLVRFYSRAGSIPSQETLAEEMGLTAKHRVRTVGRSIARLRAAGWLETSRRDQRNVKRGGRLLGGNRYHPKVSLNDLPEEVFPQVATTGQRKPAGRNDRTWPKAAKPQVATTGQQAPSPVGDGGKPKHSPRSQRGDSPVDKRPSTPTVSESKPVEERVSSRPSAQQLSPPGGPPFRTMAEEKAWVAWQRRAGRQQPAPPPSVRFCKHQVLDEEVRLVVLERRAAAAALKAADEQRSRVLAVELLGRALPGFVNTVERHVGLDAVLVKEGEAA